jgi:5'-nucleotidase
MSIHILLTNDDGISSPGIAVLREALQGLGAITTIAPSRNASGVARGITIGRPLELQPAAFGDGWEGIACDGTPADCVRVGFLGVERPIPDLVVSGVNLGCNLGTDVTYSGTVGAAFEAALRGRPGIAFSVHSRTPSWLHEAVPLLRSVVELVLGNGLPPSSILNVNLPDSPLAEVTGIRPARLAPVSLHDKVFLHEGHEGLVPHGRPESDAQAHESLRPGFVPLDVDLVSRGYVTVTPLRYDLMHHGLLDELRSWRLETEVLSA